jgi:hypothetical protein
VTRSEPDGVSAEHRNPLRCQGIRVSGCTIVSAALQSISRASTTRMIHVASSARWALRLGALHRAPAASGERDSRPPAATAIESRARHEPERVDQQAYGGPPHDRRGRVFPHAKACHKLPCLGLVTPYRNLENSGSDRIIADHSWAVCRRCRHPQPGCSRPSRHLEGTGPGSEDGECDPRDRHR